MAHRAAQLFRFDKKRYDALVKQGFNLGRIGSDVTVSNNCTTS